MHDHRFLALGDSYTIGEGVPEQQRWPAQLVARLRAGDVPIAEPQIIARTGWTTDELAAAMDAAQFQPPYQLVTLLIGVNNQYRGRPLDEYREQFRSLLQRAIGLTGSDPHRVLVISIPDWGVTSFAHDARHDRQQIATQIDAFNEAAREEADAQRARFVDVTDISRDPHCRHLLVADGLHPSGAQYARWLGAIAPVAAEILEL
jgi:lysophospholipase L1-like esterase